MAEKELPPKMEFQTNIPAEVEFRFDDPKQGEGQYGPYDRWSIFHEGEEKTMFVSSVEDKEATAAANDGERRWRPGQLMKALQKHAIQKGTRLVITQTEQKSQSSGRTYHDYRVEPVAGAPAPEKAAPPAQQPAAASAKKEVPHQERAEKLDPLTIIKALVEMSAVIREQVKLRNPKLSVEEMIGEVGRIFIQALREGVSWRDFMSRFDEEIDKIREKLPSEVYNAILNEHEFENASEITKREDQEAVYKELKKALKELAEAPPSDERGTSLREDCEHEALDDKNL